MENAEEWNELPEVALRMDEALEAIGQEFDPMMLSELNGFLCGIITSPEEISPEEWIREIWASEDSDGAGPFKNAEETRRFTECVMAYYASIAEELDTSEFQPIFDIDPEEGDVVWELWAMGFGRAIALRPDAWDKYLQEDDDTIDATMHLLGLVAIAGPEEDSDVELTEDDIAEIQEAAPDIIPHAVMTLFDFKASRDAGPTAH